MIIAAFIGAEYAIMFAELDLKLNPKQNGYFQGVKKITSLVFDYYEPSWTIFFN